MKHQPTALGTTCLALAVCLSAIGCTSTQTPGTQLDDRTITTKITSKLAADADVNPFNVDVDTLDGVVTLRGKVEKELARSEAERLALETSGVRAVRNLIRVVPEGTEASQPVTDAWITAKIKSKLTADPQLNPFNIDVDTDGGRVTLSGKVRTAAAKIEAENLARDTRGVISVDNELVVVDDDG